MHSWQNGTRCRDGVNVLWYCYHLVWLVFEGSIHVLVFVQKSLVVCSCCFVFFFSEIVREERRGAQGESMYTNIKFCCSKGTMKELS